MPLARDAAHCCHRCCLCSGWSGSAHSGWAGDGHICFFLVFWFPNFFELLNSENGLAPTTRSRQSRSSMWFCSQFHNTLVVFRRWSQMPPLKPFGASFWGGRRVRCLDYLRWQLHLSWQLSPTMMGWQGMWGWPKSGAPHARAASHGAKGMWSLWWYGIFISWNHFSWRWVVTITKEYLQQSQHGPCTMSNLL